MTVPTDAELVATINRLALAVVKQGLVFEVGHSSLSMLTEKENDHGEGILKSKIPVSFSIQFIRA